MTLNDDADPELWQPEDHPYDALYLHRLVVRRSSANQDLGALILDWASEQARTNGKYFLRLDAWTNNPRLHDYYRDQGFRSVRLVNAPGIVSGALSEKSV